MTRKLLSVEAFSLVSDLETPAYDLQHLSTLADGMWNHLWGAAKRQGECGRISITEQEGEALLYSLGMLAFKAHNLNQQITNILQAPAVQS